MNDTELKFLTAAVSSISILAGVTVSLMPEGTAVVLNPLRVYAIVVPLTSNTVLSGTWKGTGATVVDFGTNNRLYGFLAPVLRTGYISLPNNTTWIMFVNICAPSTHSYYTYNPPSNGSFMFRFTIYLNGTVRMDVHVNSTIGEKVMYTQYLRHLRNVVIGFEALPPGRRLTTITPTVYRNDTVVFHVYDIAMPEGVAM